MQKFKLINNKTKEETTCKLVTIDGFNYYISDNPIKALTKLTFKNVPKNYVYNKSMGIRDLRYKHNEQIDDKLIICTNNPNIDIPQVIEENTIIVNNAESLKEDCPNGEFQVRKVYFLKGYNKAKETYKYTEEDLISFAYFYFIEEFNSTMQSSKSTEKLLSMWKEQQITTIFYE